MMGYRDLRDPRTGKLLARYDPKRDLLEIAARGSKALFDLRQLRSEPAAGKQPPPRSQRGES